MGGGGLMPEWHKPHNQILFLLQAMDAYGDAIPVSTVVPAAEVGLGRGEAQ